MPSSASKSSPPNATFYTVTQGGADTYWRAEMPVRALGAIHRKLPADSATKRLLKPKPAGPFPWYIEDTDGGRLYPTDEDLIWDNWHRMIDRLRYPAHEGTAVFTSPCGVRAKHAISMSAQGITTVAEFDDNRLSPARLNLFMRENKWDDTAREEHLRASVCFDRIVFSTGRLRDIYLDAWRTELPRRHANPPEPFICRNNAWLEDWPERDEGDGRIRVGWMGSPQHARDIKLGFQALAWARLNGCEVVMIGCDVRDETGVMHPRAREGCRAWRSVITRHVPWKAPGEYHRSALPLDIGLAPVELNSHTLGKSDVKAIEYAIAGAVPVLQNHPIYSDHWKHNETCLLAGSPAEFEHCVKELVNSPSLRQRLLSAAQQYVREERSDRQTREEWGAACAA